MSNAAPPANAIIENDTGEVQTLDSIATQVRRLLGRMEQDAWEIGRLVSIAHKMCESKDCGIDGDNSKAQPTRETPNAKNDHARRDAAIPR